MHVHVFTCHIIVLCMHVYTNSLCYTIEGKVYHWQLDLFCEDCEQLEELRLYCA